MAAPALSSDICSQQSLDELYAIQNSKKGFLGSGAFSQVYLAVDKRTGEKRAVKRIARRLMATKKNGKRVIDLSPIEQEVKLQRLCCAQTENIVKIFDVFDSGQTIDIVLEPMLKEDLFDAIERVYYPEDGNMGDCRYSESEAAKIARQVACAVMACHEHKVCHRDLKPENILVHAYHPDGWPIVKLCDFGLATTIKDGQHLSEACGTPEYVAPEVVTKLSKSGAAYGFPADIWSIGILLFILLCGEQPFRGDGDKDNTKQVLEAVKSHRSLQKVFQKPADQFGPNIWADISEDAKVLVDKLLLNPDPSQRPTARELYNHPWMSGKSALTKAIPNTLLPLHKAWLRRKFRVAIFAMMATNRIRTLVSNLHAEKVIEDMHECTAAACHKLLEEFRAANPASAEEALVNRDSFVAVLKKSGLAPGMEEAHFDMFATSTFGSTENKSVINYRDYCVGLGWRSNSDERKKLELLFAAFDADTNGMIDHDEFVVMMTALNSRVVGNGPPQRSTIASTSGLFAEIDTNGDGLVDLDEFLAWASASGLVHKYLTEVSLIKTGINTAVNTGQSTGPKAIGRDSVAATDMDQSMTATVPKAKQSSCCVIS